jgi:hypothetical protein
VVAQVASLHRIVVAGAVLSIWMVWELTVSALPALSTEKNFTVEVLDTENAPVYLVLDVVGVDPLVLQ